MPNMEENTLNIRQNILNIKMQIQNIEMQMNDYMSRSMNNNIGMINNIFGMSMNNNLNMIMNNNMVNNDINNIKKKDIEFVTTNGSLRNITMNYGETIGQALKKYLIEIKKPELINRNDKLKFLYNEQRLNFDDDTKIEDYFKGNKFPRIIVSDANYL